MIPKLRVRKKVKTWWIVGDKEDGPYGPYGNYKEAREECVNLIKFFEAAEKGNQKFFTTTPVTKKAEWNRTNTKKKY